MNVLSLADLQQEALRCAACPLAQSRTQVVFGTGDPNARLMFVGEAPGRDEDLIGEPFVGRSGALLDRLIAEELQLDRSSLYIANVVKCRPPGNRDPRPEEVAACSRYLRVQVDVVAPEVIVTLGNFATRALLERTEGITRLRGTAYRFAGRWLVPTFHPAAALRGGGETVAKMRADLVRAALLLDGTGVTPNPASLPAGRP